jgi:hypothetical protein
MGSMVQPVRRFGVGVDHFLAWADISPGLVERHRTGALPLSTEKVERARSRHPNVGRDVQSRRTAWCANTQ